MTLEPGERIAVVLHEGEPEPGVLGSNRVPVDPVEVVIPKADFNLIEVRGTFVGIPETLYDPWISLWRHNYEHVLSVRVELDRGWPRMVAKGSNISFFLQAPT